MALLVEHHHINPKSSRFKSHSSNYLFHQNITILLNRPVRPVCDPTATLLRCNFHQKHSGVAENCQKIIKSMRQVAHSTLLTRSLRSHYTLTATYAFPV